MHDFVAGRLTFNGDLGAVGQISDYRGAKTRRASHVQRASGADNFVGVGIGARDEYSYR